MEFSKEYNEIDGLLVLTSPLHYDDRGYFLENWKKEGFTSLEEVEEHDRKRLVKQTKKEASPYPIKNPVFSPYTDLLPWEEDEEG